jgi:hypothetical protein
MPCGPRSHCPDLPLRGAAGGAGKQVFCPVNAHRSVLIVRGDAVLVCGDSLDGYLVARPETVSLEELSPVLAPDPEALVITSDVRGFRAGENFELQLEQCALPGLLVVLTNCIGGGGGRSQGT